MASDRLGNTVIAIVAIHWLTWGLLSTYWGGTALGGEIAEGVYLIRRQPGALGTDVSPEFWFFTLIYSTITFGFTFPIISLIVWFRDPPYARGWIHHGSVIASLLFMAAILAQAAARYTAWHAA